MKKIAFPNDILIFPNDFQMTKPILKRIPEEHSGLEENRLIDVGLFEDLPFSDKHTVINKWRESDIFDLLLKEGHISREERLISKIAFVRTSKYKDRCTGIYSIGISIMTEKTSFEYRNIEDMDQKIRDIRLATLL